MPILKIKICLLNIHKLLLNIVKYNIININNLHFDILFYEYKYYGFNYTNRNFTGFSSVIKNKLLILSIKTFVNLPFNFNN